MFQNYSFRRAILCAGIISRCGIIAYYCISANPGPGNKVVGVFIIFVSPCSISHDEIAVVISSLLSLLKTAFLIARVTIVILSITQMNFNMQRISALIET